MVTHSYFYSKSTIFSVFKHSIPRVTRRRYTPQLKSLASTETLALKVPSFCTRPAMSYSTNLPMSSFAGNKSSSQWITRRLPCTEKTCNNSFPIFFSSSVGGAKNNVFGVERKPALFSATMLNVIIWPDGNEKHCWQEHDSPLSTQWAIEADVSIFELWK